MSHSVVIQDIKTTINSISTAYEDLSYREIEIILLTFKYAYQGALAEILNTNNTLKAIQAAYGLYEAVDVIMGDDTEQSLKNILIELSNITK